MKGTECVSEARGVVQYTGPSSQPPMRHPNPHPGSSRHQLRWQGEDDNWGLGSKYGSLVRGVLELARASLQSRCESLAQLCIHGVVLVA